MQYARVYGAQTSLLTSHIISVETDLSRGLHSFTIVGLPDKAVEEAKDRVSAAIKHTGYESPKSKNQKVVISLAPADVKKEGPHFDVPIALSYLLAAGDIRFDPESLVFIGELALDGSVRPVHGILPLVAHALSVGKKAVWVPAENAQEAALVRGIEVYGAHSLQEILLHIDERTAKESRVFVQPTPPTDLLPSDPDYMFSLDDIRGQYAAKRAAVIAAAGGHNLALQGPPGTGKTMLARAIASILPPLTFEEALEVNSIHSVAGVLRSLMSTPPFRSPHHSASHVAIIGGGAHPKPGEVTLAHRGVLFLDEFPEFDRRVIEALRQPLEDRVVSVARARGSAIYPAQFTLVAAMNPCPCGNWGNPAVACTCLPQAIEKYKRKISGPIADRIDLWVEMGPVAIADLGEKRETTSHETNTAKEQVASARARQHARYGTAKTNAQLSARELNTHVALADDVRATLDAAATKLALSPRAYHRVIKVARTIADLRAAEHVGMNDILEALQYRAKRD